MSPSTCWDCRGRFDSVSGIRYQVSAFGRVRGAAVVNSETDGTGSEAAVRPLDGITVVTLEHAIAAPFCTRQLADLGARVVKVERPGAGDFARAYDDRAEGQSSHFVWTNRSKESLALDLKQPADLAVLKV